MSKVKICCLNQVYMIMGRIYRQRARLDALGILDTWRFEPLHLYSARTSCFINLSLTVVFAFVMLFLVGKFCIMCCFYLYMRV